MYDCIIIGSGPSGLGTAIYLARAKMKTLIVGFPKKSNLSKSHLIQNYLGFPEGIAGKDLLNRFLQQVRAFGAEFLEEEAVDLKRKGDFFAVKTSSMREFESKNLVIATGMSYKLSGIKNEEELIGKGIHYCASCDGWFYANKKIAIVGKGNFAADEALDLLKYSKNISIFSNGNDFFLSDSLKKAISENNILLRTEKIFEFGKNPSNNAITLLFENSKKEEFDGVFIAMGTAGAFNFAQKLGIELNKSSIKTDSECRTNVKGVYAVGDSVGGISQIAFAIGMGCIAAFSIIKNSKNKEVYIDYG